MGKELSNKAILSMTKKAFKNNEVFDLLQGSNGYECPLCKFVPAYVPTDFGRVISEGIYKYYQSYNSNDHIKIFTDSIIKLMNGSPVQVWIAYHICWSLYYNENNGSAPFNVVDNILLSNLRDSINKNKEALKICKEWQGWQQKDGLWGDIEACEYGLKSKFGMCLL